MAKSGASTLTHTSSRREARGGSALVVGRLPLVQFAMANRGTVRIVPLTTNTKRLFDFQVHIPVDAQGLDHDSKAQAEQIRTISTERLISRVGAVNEEMSAAFDQAIRLYLAL